MRCFRQNVAWKTRPLVPTGFQLSGQSRAETSEITSKRSVVSSVEGKKQDSVIESEGRSVVSDSLQPRGLYGPWNSPGQNTGVGGLSLLQGIFPTQGLNPGLPHCRWIHYQLSHQGGPMTNLNSLFKSRDITLPTKVRLLKAMAFPVVTYGCEN